MADDGAAGGLGGAHAQARKILGDPEECDAFRDIGEGVRFAFEMHGAHQFDVAVEQISGGSFVASVPVPSGCKFVI